ncbi:MAG: hypothetical protein M3O32_21085, partial [Actinomycetota bacterium]|nr:hypothetical protein [Actinomycetota bacterium]
MSARAKSETAAMSEMAVSAVVATVGDGVVHVEELDVREEQLRATRLTNALPRPGTSEGRQLRRWLVQVLVTALFFFYFATAVGFFVYFYKAEGE